jgi:hypothetical protein
MSSADWMNPAPYHHAVMKGFLRTLVLVAAACVLASQADAQQGRDRGRGQGPKGPPAQHYRQAAPGAYGYGAGGMSHEQRERIRQDVNSGRRGAYQGGPPPEYDPRRPPPRQMTPDERDRFRRDIQNANRDFERRR